MVRYLLAVVAVLGLTVPAAATDYIVKQKSGRVVQKLKSLTIKDFHAVGQLYKVKIEDSDQAKTLKELLTDPGVEYVVPDFKLYAFRTPPTIAQLKEQWALAKVNAQRAWELARNKGSSKIIVAVIDTGVDYKHGALATNMIPGYDFRNNDDDPMDETSSKNPGHGTHCAGIVGANGVVEDGTVGISPEVSIMPLRFLGSDGSGDLMAAVKAIDYAIEKKVRVISASWGAAVSREQAKPLVDALKRADDAGVIFVAAAANDGKSNDTTEVYPANGGFPNMISVAASGPNDEKPSWSNYGKATVNLASPGLNIMSTLPGNKYGNLSGTSMATPLVSGLVAFLLAQDESLTGLKVKSLLQATGSKVSIETACNCRVDAGAAMEALALKKKFIFPNAMTIRPQETQQFGVANAVGAVEFKSSNDAIASFDKNGVLSAKGEGEITVSATDSQGQAAQSLTIRVAKRGGGDNPNPPGTECPFEDPMLCDLICQIQPDMPWCKK